LLGGAGDDTLDGGADDDLLSGGLGADSIDGGAGDDTLTFAEATAGVTVDLSSGGSNGEALGDTYSNIENVIGSDYSDFLVGTASDNRIEGGAGSDQLSGLAGDDALFGGAGDDRLDGGAGADYLDGGAGNNEYHFGAGDAAGDVIVDTGGHGSISTEAGDTVDFSGLASVSGVIDLDIGEGGAAQFAGIQDVFLEGLNSISGSGPSSSETLEYTGQFLDLTGVDLTNLGSEDAIVVHGDSEADNFNLSTAAAAASFLLGSGDDIAAGGSGDDTFTVTGPGDVDLAGGSGDDSVSMGDSLDGNDTLVGGSGVDTLSFTAADDLTQLDGASGFEVFVLSGSEDADIEIQDSLVDCGVTAVFNAGAMTGGLSLGLDNDTDAHFAVTGGSGGDVLFFDAITGQDSFDGGAGNDTLFADGVSNDFLDGVSNVEQINLDGSGLLSVSALDSLVAANATLNIDASDRDSGWDFDGSAETDGKFNIYSSDYDDILSGGAGNDSIYGNAGDDTIDGGAGADSLDGGAGDHDVVSWQTSTAAVTVSLYSGVVSGGSATGDTISGFENAWGTELSNDSLVGSTGDNELRGLSGDDILDGGDGNDTLWGDGRSIYETLDGQDEDWQVVDAAGAWRSTGGAANGYLEATAGSGDAWFTATASESDTLAVFLGGTLSFDLNVLSDGEGRNTSTVQVVITDSLGNTATWDSEVAPASGTWTTFQADFIDDGRWALSGSTLADILADVQQIGIQAGYGTGAVAGLDNFSIWGAGADDLSGELGDDELHGGAGADVLAGGDGSDTASYAESSAGVNVTVNATSGNTGGYAEGDQLYDMENLIGSAHDDTLTGDAGVNRLEGGAGDDLLIGGAGGDMLIGGLGDDTASYATAGAAVEVNLANGVGTGGDAAGDSYMGIENIEGSGFADTLTGDGGDNHLSGGAGNDTLTGGAGADVLFGGDGDDRFDFSNGDVAAGESVDGGSDTDTVKVLDDQDVDFSQASILLVENLVLGQNAVAHFGSGNQEFLEGLDAISGYSSGTNETLEYAGSALDLSEVDLSALLHDTIVINGTDGADHFVLSDTNAAVTFNLGG
ncbi:MAG: beta strand repeat-containing protein, partial [Solirubrobacteraceae bacterium]